MKREEKKLKFIQARAMGFSLKKTAEKLGVSLASCKKWEKAFKTEVDEAKAEYTEEVAEAQTIEPPTDEELDALRTIGPTAIIGNRENAVKLLRYTLDHMEEIIANLEN